MRKKLLSVLLCLALCLSLLPAALAEEAERFLSFPRSIYPNGPMGMEEQLYYGDRMETRVLLPQQYNNIQQVSAEPNRFLVQRIVPEDSQSGGSIYRYGLVDDYGQFILPEEYTDCKTGWEDFEDLLAFAKDGKYAHYSLSQEKFITEFAYDAAKGFDELGIVGIHTAYDENGAPSRTLYGAVDRQGKLVIPLEYSSLSVSHYGASFIFARKGEAYGNTGDGPDPQVRDGAFDYAGNPLRACVYPSTQLLSAALCMDVPLHASGEAKLKEEELSITWLPQYDWVEYEPSTARLSYRIGAEGGIARLDGTDITGPVYHYGPTYSSFDGMGWYAYDYDADEFIYLDPDGNILPEKPAEKPSVSYRYDENYGFLLTDERGNALSPKLEGAYYDVAPWDAGEGLFGFVRNGKVGFSDAAGKVVIEPKYDYSLYHSPGFDYRFQLNGLAPIYQEGGGRGFIDVKGNWYDRWDLGMLSADEGPNGKYGYRDEDWNLVVPYLFDNVGEFKNGYALVRRDGVYGLLKDPRTENAAEKPVPAPASGTVFTDVPAGSWYDKAVATCAEKGVMVGTGEGLFSPNAELTDPECLTLALRLYDLWRGGDGTLEKAPEDYGYMTFTLSDGKTFYRYGEYTPFFSYHVPDDGSAGIVYVQAPGDTPEEREAYAKAHEGAATFVAEGKAYSGTVTAGTFGYYFGPCLLFSFDCPEAQRPDLDDLFSHGYLPAPDKWYRDAVYTAYQWGLDDADGFSVLVDRATYQSSLFWTDRQIFARALAVAAGELEKKYEITRIPDVERTEYNEGIYRLYEAGILNGQDSFGTFWGDKYLTRAECAAMVARVLDPDQRLTSPPTAPDAYQQAVISLRTGFTYLEVSEKTYDTDHCTVFVYDRGGAPYSPRGNVTLIYKSGSALEAGTRINCPIPNVLTGVHRDPPEVMALSEDGNTFTYSYYYDDRVHTCVVDLATGETAESDSPITYENQLALMTQAVGYTIEKQLETDECTVFLRWKPLSWWDDTRDYDLWVLRKDEAGTRHRLLLPSTTLTEFKYTPTDRAPDSLSLSPDGKTLTYTYRFTDQLWNGDDLLHDKGTYVYTMDIPTAKQAVELVAGTV